jgi:hypothetical protein
MKKTEIANQLKSIEAKIRAEADAEKKLAIEEVEKRIQGKLNRRLQALKIAIGELTPTSEEFKLTPPPADQGHGKITNEILQTAFSLKQPFTSGDVFREIKKRYPEMIQSSVSTVLIRARVKGQVEEVGRNGRVTLFKKVDSN